MFPRLSAAGFRVLGLGVGASAIALVTRWIEFAVIAITSFTVLGVAGLFLIGRIRCTTRLDVVPRSITAGESASVRIGVLHHGGRAGRFSDLRIGIGAGTPAIPITHVQAGQLVTHVVEVTASRRGIVPIGPIVASRSDPLGLVGRQRRIGAPDQLIVRPRTVLADRSGTSLIDDALHALSVRLPGVADDMQSVRRFVPGDDHRRIHWRTSARRGEVMVRNSFDVATPRLVVILDCDAASHSEDAGFELAVSIAASVASAAMSTGREVELWAGGDALPTTSKTALLDACATVASGPDRGVAVPAATEAGAQVVVVSGDGFPIAQLVQLDALEMSAALVVLAGGDRRIRETHSGTSHDIGAIVAEVRDLFEIIGVLRGVASS